MVSLGQHAPLIAWLVAPRQNAVATSAKRAWGRFPARPGGSGASVEPGTLLIACKRGRAAPLSADPRASCRPMDFPPGAPFASGHLPPKGGGNERYEGYNIRHNKNGLFRSFFVTLSSLQRSDLFLLGRVFCDAFCRLRTRGGGEEASRRVERTSYPPGSITHREPGTGSY